MCSPLRCWVHFPSLAKGFGDLFQPAAPIDPSRSVRHHQPPAPTSPNRSPTAQGLPEQCRLAGGGTGNQSASPQSSVRAMTVPPERAVRLEPAAAGDQQSHPNLQQSVSVSPVGRLGLPLLHFSSFVWFFMAWHFQLFQQ